MLNLPKEKGRLEPGTESPATGMKELVRMAGTHHLHEVEERSSTQWHGFAWGTRS